MNNSYVKEEIIMEIMKLNNNENTVCISQDRLGYAEITNKPRVLVVYTPKVCFSLLLHVCPWPERHSVSHPLHSELKLMENQPSGTSPVPVAWGGEPWRVSNQQ